MKYVLDDIDDLNRKIQEIEGKREAAKTDRLKVRGVFFSSCLRFWHEFLIVP